LLGLVRWLVSCVGWFSCVGWSRAWLGVRWLSWGALGLRLCCWTLLASYVSSYTGCMADTVTIRTDPDTEHALDVLTRDGTNRSEAIRQALLEAAVRRERLAEMKRAFLRHPMPAPDGVNLADDIAREREGYMR